MGVKGEVSFVKMAGARLLQGPVMVRSQLRDGEIERATIPDYCAYLRVMSWVDIFDLGETAAVRARYEEERPRGGMRYQTCGGDRKRQFKILMNRIGWVRHIGGNRAPHRSNSFFLTLSHNELAVLWRALSERIRTTSGTQ